MARDPLNCWHCGTPLQDIPLPIGRREECPHCSSSLHVCRMCEFYDVSAAKQCREPMADEVTDKEAANFCDYFRPRYGLTAAADPDAADARAKLAALFGDLPAHDEPRAKRPATEDDATRAKLDSLFNEGED